jgi:hypothetical protein
MMNNEQDRLLGKGVRDLVAGARSWAGKLEAQSSGILAVLLRAFQAILAGEKPRWDLRTLALVLLNAIQQLIAQLLAAETLHQETLTVELPAARGRRDTAREELSSWLKAFRAMGLTNRRGPVIPPGRLPETPERVAALAAAIRPELDCPELQAGPMVQLLPNLRPDFDQAAAELAAATAGVEEALARAHEAREARDATIRDLRLRQTAARSLHQAIHDLRGLDLGKK